MTRNVCVGHLWVGALSALVLLCMQGCGQGLGMDLSEWLNDDTTDSEDGGTWVDGEQPDAGFGETPSDGGAPPSSQDPAVCGDGDLDSDEECDDGNTDDDDGCDSTCEIEEGWSCHAQGSECEQCGDGVVDAHESCDDGNTSSGDGCSQDCRLEKGFRCPVPDSACEECGNGVVESTEVCDDGNTSSGDGCSESCTFTEANYACPVPGEACEKCGDGVVDEHESCDDGNAAGGDGCNAACTAVEVGFDCSEQGEPCEPICGDAVLAADESCDDRNTDAGDGCDGSCQLEEGWTCPVVGIACEAAACNDGIVAGNEQCEDGNTDDGDGCDADCFLEDGYACHTAGEACTPTVCNDGTKEGNEPCDDGNNVVGDGCNPFCEVEPDCSGGVCTSACGDGMMLVTDDEECDDGNTRSGDGCSSDCQIEPGHECTVVESELPDVLEVPVTFRDFNALPSGGATRHGDFEAYSGSHATPGMVEAALGGDGKPVYTGICETGSGFTSAECPYDDQTTSQAEFDQWYNDVDGVNLSVVERLTMDQQPDGSYYFPDSAFFPFDGRGWVGTGDENASDDHNFGFTSEVRYWFEFQGGEFLRFSGDDDVWVFIGGELALDLGGLHPQREGTVTLNADGTADWERVPADGEPGGTGTVDLGLQVGDIYEVALFHAERHTNASNFNLTLNGFVSAKSACETVCGDGVVTRDELCDDGEHNGEYGRCGEDCLTYGPYCGDGVLQTDEGEECDDGVANGGYGGYGQCAPGCVPGPYCGDGHKDVGHEQCDDGNSEEGDGCTPDCELEWCGNGTLDPGEECDDGNTAAGDGCSPRCDVEACGNGWVDPGEECDDGVNDGGYGECGEGCVLGPRCGDGEIQRDEGEQCDDGNTEDNDACDAECQLESIS